MEDGMEKPVVEKSYGADGSVAVLVSPGFGAGWSTWASDEYREFALFDKGLVELALRKASTDEVSAYIQEKLNGEDFYVGGWPDIQVELLPAGTRFYIEEYDGSETIKLAEDLINIA